MATCQAAKWGSAASVHLPPYQELCAFMVFEKIKSKTFNDLLLSCQLAEVRQWALPYL